MRIIYTRPDGGVSVIVPSPNWTGTMEDLAAKDVPAGLDFEIVEDDAIPADRTFRNAWTRQDKGVVVDEEKAKEILAFNVRVERVAEFEKNDIALRDALISGDQRALDEAVARRDYLRDLPQEIMAATLEEAKEITL